MECLSLEKENLKLWDSFAQKKSDKKKIMLENGEIAGKLKNNQFGVFSSLENLEKSRQYFEKMSLKEMELKK